MMVWRGSSWCVTLFTLLATGCGGGSLSNDRDGSVADASIPSGAPIEASAFCARLAAITCQMNDTCCEGSTPGGTETTCEERETEACGDALEAYLDDPRVGYVPERGGAYLAELERRAGACFVEPPSVGGFFDLFAGTGVADADCTPRDPDDDVQLRLSQASCSDGLACHLYRRSDGEAQGVCEPPEADGACSHRFDCSEGEWCNLPADWSPGRWGDCQPVKTNGWDCTGDLECASRYCDGLGVCADPPATRYCDARTYDQAVSLDAPVGYWRLGDASAGGAARDDSQNGLAGSFSSGASRVAEGALAEDGDGALRLDGESSATLPELEELMGSELTLELWFRREGASVTGPLLEFFFDEQPGVRLWNHDGPDRVHANFFDVEGGEHAITSAEGVVAADEWVHLVATYDGTTMRLYANGESVGEARMEDFEPDVAGIGQVGFREGDERRILGAIDEIAIYDRALGVATIRTHRDIGREGPLDQTFPLYDWVR